MNNTRSRLLYALLLFGLALLPACKNHETAAIDPVEPAALVEAPKAPQFLIMPVEGGRITSRFGPRKLRRERQARMHNGIDIAAARGTGIVAPADGEVVFTGVIAGYGRTVELDHGGGLQTRYAHLDKITVARGDVLATGDKLGTVGRTGKTTGPNLHFEVILDGERIDPLSLAMWDRPVWEKYLAEFPGFTTGREEEAKVSAQ
ncbi:MAG: M23 family metallopeptidase [Deltaproteobacteria bacterium]|jgi:murein DD-endopeptidase MepM/ murein hydrolase activator NlpD|nr:M23 family metallopeptidase [Deltaproteobacteria bacterium]